MKLPKLCYNIYCLVNGKALMANRANFGKLYFSKTPKDVKNQLSWNNGHFMSNFTHNLAHKIDIAQI
jgi:hypothetical protein